MARTDRQARRHFFTSLAALPLLAALAFAPEAAQAQWTTTGNTVHPTDSTKTVAVGATAATNQLEVVDSSSNTGTLADVGSFPLALENSDQTNNNTVGINFRSRASNGTLYGIGGIALRSTSHLSTAYNSDIEFYNRNNNVVSTPFVIKSSGSVGFGTSAPNFVGFGRALSVYNSGGNTGLELVSGYPDGAGVSVGELSGVFDSNAAGHKRIGGIGFVTQGATASQRGASIYFATKADASTSYSERMRIDSAGNVGIGTTTPSVRLHVAGGTRVDGTNGRVYLGAPALTNYRGLELIEESATLFSIRHHNPNTAWQHIALNPHGGNVGIGTGTANPAYKLDVQDGAVNASGGLCIDGVCKTSWTQVGGSQWTTNGSNINYSAGSVGIGTSAPTSKFEVADASNNGVAARLYQTNSSASNGLIIQTQTGSAGDLSLHVSSNAGATVGLSVRNTGNVGVGTGSPVGRLDVRQISNAGTLATILTSSGTSEDTFVRGGSSSATVHIGDLTSTTSKLLLMENGGNVGIGTTSPTERLHVVGNIKVTGNIEAKFQDVAEWVPTRERLAAGTVVVLDTTASNHVVASTTAYDTGVAGVVSEQPGLILGEGGEGKVMVATTGRVRVKVDATRAPIRIGDLLVTGETPGVAMKSEPVTVGGRKMHAPGTIVGKALEPLAGGTGEILVLLSLQ